VQGDVEGSKRTSICEYVEEKNLKPGRGGGTTLGKKTESTRSRCKLTWGKSEGKRGGDAENRKKSKWVLFGIYRVETAKKIGLSPISTN